MTPKRKKDLIALNEAIISCNPLTNYSLNMKVDGKLYQDGLITLLASLVGAMLCLSKSGFSLAY